MSMPTGTFVHALGHNWLGKADIAVQTILLAAVSVIVGFRLWSRRRLQISLQGNDWFIVAATIVMLGRYVVELLLILLCGMGLHADEVDRTGGGPEAFVRFKKLTYIGELLWATVLGLTQLSILQYYLRRLQQRLAMRLSYAGMGLCSALWIASSLATAFICTPSRKVWLASLEGDCGNRNKLHTGCAVSGLILNVFILLLPLPVIRNMQLTWPKKVWLAIIYILGLVLIGLSAVRIKTELFLISGDSTYGSARGSLLSSVETLLGIIVACLPVLAPGSQRINGTTECTSIVQTPRSDHVANRYWKASVLSNGQMEDSEPEIPPSHSDPTTHGKKV
ncbi:uncharacterized protein N7469_001596 [Penicillium citrinum]|uniref:Rhodopsin domain-containing protein n=1 Tax=Penicillium citrinum TaxID=5077 RepID=A0A9W9PH53_PENCI|nr:uncharacterized protein N7469_001596 [Penicillium citrinum]KAJ5243269.1 hypothetical protein N7469_001596 [Penicillium citrinum]